MKGNGLIFEAFKQQLRQLGEHLGSGFPRSSKDPEVQYMIEEALVHLFSQSHDRFRELVASFHEAGKDCAENCSSTDMFSEGMNLLIKEKWISQAQAQIVAEQCSSATLLATDRVWLTEVEHKKLFLEHIQKIPRYYHLMSTVVGVLSRFTVSLPSQDHA